MALVLVALGVQVQKCHQDRIGNDDEYDNQVYQIQFVKQDKRAAASVVDIEQSKVYEYAGNQHQCLAPQAMSGKIRMQSGSLYERKYALAQEINTYGQGNDNKDFYPAFHLSSSKCSLPTPHAGQVQSSGISSKAVPGAIPFSGSPSAGS